MSHDPPLRTARLRRAPVALRPSKSRMAHLLDKPVSCVLDRERTDLSASRNSERSTHERHSRAYVLASRVVIQARQESDGNVRVLALDPGTRCGWALGVDGQYVASGVWDLAPQRLRRFEGGGMRYLRLEQCLNEFGMSVDRLPEDYIDRVVFEEVHRHLGTDAAHVYGGCIAIIMKWCERHGIPYSTEPVKSIKKWATGNGNASKTDMMVYASAALGREVESDDEADAVALLFMAMEQAP